MLPAICPPKKAAASRPGNVIAYFDCVEVVVAAPQTERNDPRENDGRNDHAAHACLEAAGQFLGGKDRAPKRRIERRRQAFGGAGEREPVLEIDAADGPKSRGMEVPQVKHQRCADVDRRPFAADG